MNGVKLKQMKATVRVNNWREDEDGFLRVTMRVLAEGVYPYSDKEHGAEAREAFKGKTTIREFIDRKNFTADALKTLEGKPVIIEGHEWRDIDNTLTDGLTVGNIAGTPYVEEDGIIADAIISNPAAIKAIKDGKLVEVSAAYESELDVVEGNEQYDAVQGIPRFNHVLLIPSGKGRCGEKVRILNSNSAKETQMKVKIKNSKGEKTYEFSNEKDGEIAEGMARDVQDSAAAEKEEAVKAKDGEVKTANHDLETAKAELETMKAKVKDLEETIAKFASEEYQEAMATERGEYKAQEEVVMNAEVPEEDKQKALKEKLANCKSILDRRKTITVEVMNSKGVDLSKASDDAISASFKTLVSFANSKTADASGKPPAKAKTENTKTSVHPIYQRQA